MSPEENLWSQLGLFHPWTRHRKLSEAAGSECDMSARSHFDKCLAIFSHSPELVGLDGWKHAIVLDKLHKHIYLGWKKKIQMLPVTDKDTPGKPVYFPNVRFVINLNLYNRPSLSVRFEIFRLQLLLLSQWYSTRWE